MSKYFPVKLAVDFLYKSVKDQLGDVPQDLTERVIELHLNPKHYAMGRNIDGNTILSMLKEGAKPKDIEAALVFENTKTIQGIIRVMVRTHLNRSGIGYVSRESTPKTGAKRVLGLFSYDFDPSPWNNWKTFISSWHKYVNDLSATGDPDNGTGGTVSKLDLSSLNGLLNLTDLSLKEAKACSDIHDNWARLTLGVYSGLRYLSESYGFDAKRFNKRVSHAAKSFDGVKELILEVKESISQYGTALAGSFIADLGNKDFVKLDVHVVDSLKASQETERNDRYDDEFGLNLLLESSKKYDMHPRCLDKILYLICSSNLYLIGNKRPRGQAARVKKEFIDLLAKNAK